MLAIGRAWVRGVEPGLDLHFGLLEPQGHVSAQALVDLGVHHGVGPEGALVRVVQVGGGGVDVVLSGDDDQVAVVEVGGGVSANGVELVALLGQRNLSSLWLRVVRRLTPVLNFPSQAELPKMASGT